MSIFFNGRLYTSPATMSMVDDSAMYNKNPAVGNILAIIGKSYGGTPKKAIRFGSAQDARKVLIEGEGLKAVEKAFDASAQSAGVAEVMFLRANPALQSSLVLSDGVAVPVIDLVSRGHGAWVNSIAVKIEAGTGAGTKKITTKIGATTYSADNVGRYSFYLKYTGVGVATYDVTATTFVLKVDGVAVKTVTFTPTMTLAGLAQLINSQAGFVATTIAWTLTHRATDLDFVVAGALTATNAVVSSHLRGIIDWFNSAPEALVTATKHAGAGTLPTNINYTFLADGADGADVVTQDWQDCFDELKKEDVQWVVPVTGSAAVHAMADTHCAFMTNVARMERRCVVGMVLGSTDVEAIAAAADLNSDRTSLTHLGFYDYDADGVLTLFSPYILAAQIAGAMAGLNPAESMTNKTLKVRGLERLLQNPVDTDELIKGGVLAVEKTNKGYKVVKSITTWQINTNYNRVEVSVGVGYDYVSRAVRDILDDLRGTTLSPAKLGEAESRVDTVLRELSRPIPMGIGVLVGDKTSPPYKSIKVSIDGDVLRVEFQASVGIPCNYIPVVIHAVPYTGSVGN